MQVQFFKEIPIEARRIREEVFIKEQGFIEEYDEIDLYATHLILYLDENIAAGTCRVFKNKNGEYVLGRLAVLKEYRGKHIGRILIKYAEEYVLKQGAKQLILHAQCKATDFYEKLGYVKYGVVEYEEDCPHIWMKKEVRV